MAVPGAGPSAVGSGDGRQGSPSGENGDGRQGHPLEKTAMAGKAARPESYISGTDQENAG